MFVGRTEELEQLEDAYQSHKSELVVIYGRRRIGKSALIQKFLESKPHVFSFEALEGERTNLQISHFKRILAAQLNDRFVNNMMFSSWSEIFQYITEKVIRSVFRRITQPKRISAFRV